MTLTDRGPGIGRVRFTVGGTAVPVPRATAPRHSNLTSRSSVRTTTSPSSRRR